MSQQNEEVCVESYPNLSYYKAEADNILEKLSCYGLNETDKLTLEKYFAMRKDEQGFKEAFVNDFAARRDIYLNKYHRFSAMSYPIAVIAILLTVTEITELLTVALVVSLPILAVSAIGILWFRIKYKQNKCYKNTEDFYALINKHE